ncbi:MAG: YceI family protein [Chlorobi bacterium]|nr:YceI family protein [Chlorobiota bacterium]
MIRWYVLTLGISFLLWNCTPSQENDTEPTTQTTSEPSTCYYELDTQSPQVKWTAFKTTEKIGVGGTFDSVLFSFPTTEAESIAQLIQDIEATIYTVSINSGDTGRDARIRQFFFGIMNAPDVISGKILEVSNDTVFIDIEMNGISKKVPFSLQYENDTLVLTSTINLADWEAQESVKSLNQACYDLHKGADGISKLWEEVDISIIAVIRKNCNV